MSSKELSPFLLSLRQCESELADLKNWLATHLTLDEQRDILPFFGARPHLSAFVGTLHIPVEAINALAHELDVFGHFRADLAIGDSASRAYVLVEFEDAKANSLFSKGRKYNDEWSRRFDHGFSQLVDWFWTIADLRHTGDFARRFGGSDARFFGMLVAGRRADLPKSGMERLRWRAENVAIAGHKITCVTFDDLLDAMLARMRYLRGIANAGDLT